MKYSQKFGGREVPQAERAEDGECFGGWRRGRLRGEGCIFVECLRGLVICMSARSEYGASSRGTHV